MIKRTVYLFLIAAVLLTACSAAKTANDSVTSGGEPSRDFLGVPEAAPAAEAPMEPGKPQLSDQTAQNVTERLVIRNANLSLVVKDPADASEKIAGLAQSLGGFVVTSYVYQTSTDAAGNKIMQANITVRIPADKLDQALAEIKGLAVTVNSENISGQDVTSEYTDLESHLRNLEAAEAQLQKIMDGATKTEDVLAVYNQLVAIRGQIEQVKGQMKYYKDSAALSAVSVDLIPDALSQPIEIGGWKPQGVAKDAIEALIEALQGLATAVIWFGIYILPLGLICGLPLLGGAVWFRRWRKTKVAPKA